MKQNAYPLQWPTGWKRTPAGQREGGQFDGTLDRIRRDLLLEVDRIALGGQARTHTIRNIVVISSNVPLRKDGEMFAGFREPDDPGVAVYFARKGKQVCFACDKYDRVWKNLRAIQKTIEAMRGIERWGSSSLLDRAFTGFAALPSRSQASMWELLGVEDPDFATEADVLSAWREKARAAHPDAGGSHDAMAELNAAKDNALATIRNRSSVAGGAV